jgi:hypothetical protein
MSTLAAPTQGPGSFTTGSNYGTAPSSPYDTSGGNVAGYGRPAGSFGQNTQASGYGQKSNNYGASASSVQLTDFGAVDHDNRPHGSYGHHDDDENRPLTEGGAFSGGFYPPPAGPGGSVLCFLFLLCRNGYPPWHRAFHAVRNCCGYQPLFLNRVTTPRDEANSYSYPIIL